MYMYTDIHTNLEHINSVHIPINESSLKFEEQDKINQGW